MSNKTKILYIDDEAINVQLFGLNFSRTFDVVTGYSGMEGLTLLEKYPEIQVVISDMRMPGMDGLEFINKARQNFSDKKYFIVTGFDITPEIEESLNNKVINRYFMKPYSVMDIENSIKEEV